MTNSLLFGISIFVYFFAMVLYVSYLAFRSEMLGKAASLSMLGGVVVETAALGMRWYESYQLGIGRAPLTNLYESLAFFAWTIALIYLVLERKFKIRTVGAFVAPFPFLIMAYASLNPNDIQPLVPALKSNWLIAHVVTCFVGYAAFAVSFGVSFLYLLKAGSEKRSPKSAGSFWDFLPSSSALDEIGYKTIAIGFPLLTIGIVTGAFWANVAWGTYWSWDPKETWSLIVWLIYAAYLHARITRGWRGKRAAILSIAGFAATIFCYLGVNLILSGLHSYGGAS
ncbi:MAG: c-type cytochrome biogenesis protein CcsB [Syntrophobacterales bacterium CG03_land_8_20_14_0_80_58_14]|nr:MAG: c-type cytochrome biogenesis protein CcsB [Syntrophaceae bacterium CG2_30_58_14]PIV01164.1 MAG: c-type cytochrome biogenesis protein CcsB [Syntrophobacterales bacterium CG03_land_8_20_14_0_80_58_14]